MNDKKIKQKLQLLLSVQPDEHMLHSIQREVEKKTSPMRFSLKKLLPFPIYIPLSVMAAVLLFYFSVTLIFSNSFSYMMTQAQIAMAPTQYDKAKIAYAYADKQFTDMKNDAYNPAKIPEVSHSLELANAAMSGLTLKGVKGKYTMQQCLALYTAYHTSLENMGKELGTSKKYMILKAEIDQYDMKAEKRLDSYKK